VSPTLAGPTRVAKARSSAQSGDPSRYFHDLDLGRSFVNRFNVATFDTPTALVIVGDPGRVYISGTGDYESADPSPIVLRALRSHLADMAFEVCDVTSPHGSGPRTSPAGSWSVQQRDLLEAAKDDDPDAETHFAADHEQPITGAWLAAAYHAIFSPLEREDIDLGFDPDDYPLV